MLTDLDVVNACLGSVGELPLVELTDDHPLVAAALTRIKESKIQFLAFKWWFNTDYETLPVANDKFIYTPADAISVYPIDRTDLTKRGRRLWNREKSTYEMQSPVRCIVVRDLPLEDLELQAALAVQYGAVILFQNDFDGDPQKLANAARSQQQAFTQLNAEHIRQVALNGLETLFVGAQRARLSHHQGRGHFGVR